MYLYFEASFSGQVTPPGDERVSPRQRSSALAPAPPEQPERRLRAGDTREEHAGGRRIRRTNAIRTAHLLLHYEGILSLRYGFIP